MKHNHFAERAAASAEAKKALLAKLKSKPAVAAPEPPDRAAEREARLAAVRAQREAERAEKRRKAEEAEALQREIDQFNAETLELERRAAQKLSRYARFTARR